MIELGLVKLIQGNSAVAALSPQGGFLVQVPKGQALPTWTYQQVSSVSNPTLLGGKGLNYGRWEFNCFGSMDGQGADAIDLANAIDDVLNGFAGNLTDPDQTFISSCFSSDRQHFFDDASRTYRVMLEYEIAYAQD